ncbi:MAG: hypothetical protein NT012_03620 [Candidatus Nealsonbacteria bacterium]|nr:hypothetical protein [Candidatus Nealsonbacteria bacterium]
MKKFGIAINAPDNPLIFGKIKRILIDKKLEFILFLIVLGLLMLWKFSAEIIIFAVIFFILLLYGWDSGIVLKTSKKTRKDISRKKLHTILLIIILTLLLMWKFSIETVILWMIFFTFLLYKWDSRILVGVVLAFLASCPILLVFKKEDIAEQMAIYAYCFLAMAVILQVVEFKKHPEVSEGEFFVQKKRLVLDIIPPNIKNK